MSAPRPHDTDPFHPLGSICYIESFLYICQSVPVTSSKWYVKVCLAGSYLTIAHVLFRNHGRRVENDYSIQVILPNVQVLNCSGYYLYFISGDAS